jgi:hypothetical protein
VSLTAEASSPLGMPGIGTAGLASAWETFASEPTTSCSTRPVCSITLSKDPLFDVDGNEVGFQTEHCTTSEGHGVGTPWVCTYVLKLKAGPHTQAGSVVTTGIYTFGLSTFAITGGTGAYENVRGSARMVVVDNREVVTLNLIP